MPGTVQPTFHHSGRIGVASSNVLAGGDPVVASSLHRLRGVHAIRTHVIEVVPGSHIRTVLSGRGAQSGIPLQRPHGRHPRVTAESPSRSSVVGEGEDLLLNNRGGRCRRRSGSCGQRRSRHCDSNGYRRFAHPHDAPMSPNRPCDLRLPVVAQHINDDVIWGRRSVVDPHPTLIRNAHQQATGPGIGTAHRPVDHRCVGFGRAVRPEPQVAARTGRRQRYGDVVGDGVGSGRNHVGRGDGAYPFATVTNVDRALAALSQLSRPSPTQTARAVPAGMGREYGAEAWNVSRRTLVVGRAGEPLNHPDAGRPWTADPSLRGQREVDHRSPVVDGPGDSCGDVGAPANPSLLSTCPSRVFDSGAASALGVACGNPTATVVGWAADSRTTWSTSCGPTAATVSTLKAPVAGSTAAFRLLSLRYRRISFSKPLRLPPPSSKATPPDLRRGWIAGRQADGTAADDV